MILNFLLATILLLNTSAFCMRNPLSRSNDLKTVGEQMKPGSQSPRPCTVTSLVNSLPEPVEFQAQAPSSKLWQSFDETEPKPQNVALTDKIEPSTTKSFYSTNWPRKKPITLVILALASQRTVTFEMPQDGKTRRLEEYENNLRVVEVQN